MPVIAITKTVSSADVARVKETTPLRTFTAENDDGVVSDLEYNSGTDKIYCYRHRDTNNCTCTSRVRLSGILTNTLTQREVLRARRNK